MIDLICGRLCSGKTTLARQLALENHAVCLPVDNIMLMFPDPGAERYDTISAKLMAYLLRQAVEIDRCGASVVLDWGFWTREGRAHTRATLAEAGITQCWHYLDISETVWQKRLSARNAKPGNAYAVDAGLLAKFTARFEPPAPEEIDVWHHIAE